MTWWTWRQLRQELRLGDYAYYGQVSSVTSGSSGQAATDPRGCPDITQCGWCPSSLAKLVNITPITMVFMIDISILTMVYKPTYNWGAQPCKGLQTKLVSCNIYAEQQLDLIPIRNILVAVVQKTTGPWGMARFEAGASATAIKQRWFWGGWDECFSSDGINAGSIFLSFTTRWVIFGYEKI